MVGGVPASQKDLPGYDRTMRPITYVVGTASSTGGGRVRDRFEASWEAGTPLTGWPAGGHPAVS